MPSFRVRSPLIEAVKWTGWNTAEMREFLGYAHVGTRGNWLVIENRSGIIVARPDEWVAKESDCFSIYEPVLFAARYEAARESDR